MHPGLVRIKVSELSVPCTDHEEETSSRLALLIKRGGWVENEIL
jgi:hypothetical protein